LQFNNTATEQGILQDIDFICSTNSSTYSIPDKTRNVNRWLHRVVVTILDSMGEMDFQGEIATADLSATQQEYTWPTDMLTIKRVEIDYDGDGDYVAANPFDSSSYEGTISTSAEINNIFTASNPKYDPYDNSLFLYPVPDTDVTDGLKIWYSNEVSEFTATTGGNTAEPPFPEPFHRILSLGASLDYARKFHISELISFCERELYGDRKKVGLWNELRSFFSTRVTDKPLSIRTSYYDENYK